MAGPWLLPSYSPNQDPDYDNDGGSLCRYSPKLPMCAPNDNCGCNKGHSATAAPRALDATPSIKFDDNDGHLTDATPGPQVLGEFALYTLHSYKLYI